ncbi:hypothetical protein FACHB389_15365 [Nostoc calcicola FACHB-389]|nr:hypothetical protein [Nostoc calcicola FACHB-3891]OKH34532.1 hypothetical protein FACHB389_15365 [Nostoc calcicola FACHB-389]
MSYSDFKLEEIKTRFNIKIIEQSGLIESEPMSPSRGFVKLENQVMNIDLNEIYLQPVDNLLGIFTTLIK